MSLSSVAPSAKEQKKKKPKDLPQPRAPRRHRDDPVRPVQKPRKKPRPDAELARRVIVRVGIDHRAQPKAVGVLRRPVDAADVGRVVHVLLVEGSHVSVARACDWWMAFPRVETRARKKSSRIDDLRARENVFVARARKESGLVSSRRTTASSSFTR